MAQYFTDFSEYATGAQPSDWTRRWAANFTWLVGDDIDATGGKLIRGFNESLNARNGLTWDAVDSDPDRGNVEIFFRCRFPSALDQAVIVAIARGSGAAGAENGYRHGATPTESTASLAVYNNGSPSTVGGDDPAFSYASNTFYNVRVSVSGSSHKVRVWAASDSEPANWDKEATDSSITGNGWVGLFRFRTDPVDIDVFSVGTNGDPAPTGPISSAVPTLGTITTTAVTSNSIGFSIPVTY